MTKNPFTVLAIMIIRVYRMFLSPWLGNQCRFHPTCSCYGIDAYEKHGFLKGSVLTLRRILACHPYSKRPWVDPIPERFAWCDLFGYNRRTENRTQNTNQ